MTPAGPLVTARGHCCYCVGISKQQRSPSKTSSNRKIKLPFGDTKEKLKLEAVDTLEIEIG